MSMDAQQLLSEFLASGHGAQAMDALRAQGVDDATAQQLLGHAAEAAHAHAATGATVSRSSLTRSDYPANPRCGSACRRLARHARRLTERSLIPINEDDA